MKNLPTLRMLAVLAALATHASAQDFSPPSADQINHSPTLKAITQRGALVAGSAFKYKNLNTKNPETGEQEGFFADVTRAFAKYLLGDEKKIVWRYIGGTASGNILFVVRGDVDVIIDPVAENPEFMKQVSFSEDVFLSGSAFLVKKGSPFRGLDDIKKGTTIIYDQSNTEIGLVKARHPEAKYVAFWDPIDEFDALLSGEGDALTNFYPSLFSMAARNPGYTVVGRYTDKPYGAVSRKDDPVFADYINSFVRNLKASGEYGRLYDKWFRPYGGDQRLVGRTAADIPAPKPTDWSANNYVKPADNKADLAKAEAASPTLARIRQRGALVVGNAFKFRCFAFPQPDVGQPEGFMVDLADQLARRILGDGGKVIWKTLPNEDDVAPVQDGTVDAIIDIVYLGVRIEKLDVVNFSDEVYRSGSVLLVPQGSPIQSLNNISNRTRILFVAGGEHDLRLIRLRAPDATYLSFPSYDEAVAALKAGKGDLVAGLAPYLYNYTAQDPGLTLVCKFAERPTSVVSRKDDPAFNAYVNDFIRTWRSSGAYERTYVKWFVPYGGNMVR